MLVFVGDNSKGSAVFFAAVVGFEPCARVGLRVEAGTSDTGPVRRAGASMERVLRMTATPRCDLAYIASECSNEFVTFLTDDPIGGVHSNTTWNTAILTAGGQIKSVMLGDRAGAPAANGLFDVRAMVTTELAENFVVFILARQGLATAAAAVRNAVV